MYLLKRVIFGLRRCYNHRPNPLFSKHERLTLYRYSVIHLF